MNRIVLTIIPFCTLLSFGWNCRAAETLPAVEARPNYEREALPLLQKFCHKCHGIEKTKGGINLVKFRNEDSVLSDPKLWQTAQRAVRDKEMPPEEVKLQPSDKEREVIAGWIESAFKNADPAKLPKDPGHITARRLNRTEYNNTIRDLLGVQTQAANKFPADGSGGGGFDNNADTLFIPPILLEKLLDTAGELLDQASDQRLLVSRTPLTGDRRADARAMLSCFASRADRRPVTPEELDRLTRLVDAADKKGASLKDSLKAAYKAVLISPNFLYRTEASTAEAGKENTEPHLVGDYELASRLSYFIWASMPDDQLFALAEAKTLQNPKTLAEQVSRMMADPKAISLAENFAGQWLGIQTFKNAAPPDPRRFPMFTPSLRDAMLKETILFFDAVVRKNGSLLDMLDCDYSYLNEELAKHYDIPNVKGAEFRRVTLTNRNRGGLLGMGSVLTFNSFPLRTSPVLRGKWVLSELLGSPPPPPPPSVGVLPADDKPKEGQTFRQRLELHRKKPECAGCHARMDPLGFGLEVFDPVGRFRKEIAGQPVDASGVFTTGEKFNGPVEMKSALMKKKGEFLRNLAERMLSYALGRGLESYDTWTVKAIVAELEKDCKGEALVREIVLSYPFRYRRGVEGKS